MQYETEYALRKLTKEEWSEWDSFVFQQKEGTIFHTTHWLRHQPNRILEIYVLLDFGKIVAGIPLSIVSKVGYKVVALPIMTPYSGPVLADSLYFSSSHMVAFSQICSVLKHYDAWRIKMSPYSYCQGYEKSVKAKKNSRITNIISCLDQLPEYSPSLKRNLKKAKKANIEISDTIDFDIIYSISKLSYTYSGRKHPLAKKDFILLASYLDELGLASARIATSHSGEIIACNWLPNDQHTTYNIVHGINRNFKESQAGALLLDHSIKTAHSEKKNFDLEGSSIDRINRFYKKYGAQEKSIVELSSINGALLGLLSRCSIINV